MPITTEGVSSKLGHGELFSIQHYVMKFVSDLQQLDGFLVIPDSSTNKDDRHDINEILWKVALSTIKKTKPNPVDKCIFFRRVNIHSITIGFCRMCIENIWKWLF